MRYRVLSCIKACLSSAVLLWSAWLVQSCVTACLASDVSCYSVLGECSVMHCVMACLASAILH